MPEEDTDPARTLERFRNYLHLLGRIQLGPQSGAVLGTAAYMAPEQARAEKVLTTAVDVYSLGAILYELLTGKPPFRGRTPADTILQLLEGEPQRPRVINATINRDLETICLKCLEKDPERRYGSAEALSDDLKRWLDGKPITARPVGAAGRLWRWCRRNPALAAVTAGAAATILTLSGFFYWRLADEHAQTSVALADQRQTSRDLEISKGKVEEERRRAQDNLARSLYEQARALRLSAEQGCRWRVLEQLEKAEGLRRRRQEAETPSPQRPAGHSGPEPGLPSRAELRSEAVAAMLLPDARLFWSADSGFGAQPGVTVDGRLAVSLWASDDYEQTGIVLTDVRDLRELGRWEDGSMTGTAFALSRGGKMLALAGANREGIQLWDLPAGKPIRTLKWPTPAGSNDQRATRQGLLMSSEMAFSANDRYLTAVSRSPMPKDFDLEELTDLSTSIARPNQRRMKRLFGEMIQITVLWDLQNEAEPERLDTSIQDTNRGGGVFSPDSRLIAFPTGEKTVALRDLQTPQQSAELQLPLPLVGKIAFDGKARRLACPCSSSGPQRGAVVIWDLADNVEHSRLETDFPLTASSVAFSPDECRLAVGTRGGRISLFDLIELRRQLAEIGLDW